jgi:hypothetical protein
MARRGWRVRGAGWLALALYVLISGASPAFHHDVACHLTSPTHCTACTASSPAARAESLVALHSAGLPVAGTVAAADERAFPFARSVRLPARASPA